MPRRNVLDPLVPFAVRIPSSLSVAIRLEAERSGTTLADVLRSHLSLEKVKPLAVAKPRRRQPKELGRVSGESPRVLRQMSIIGRNLEEIARAVACDRRDPNSMNEIRILEALSQIDLRIKQWGQLAARHDNASDLV